MQKPDRPNFSQALAVAKMQQGALIAREAHSALLDLKKLVDTATETIHAAEIEIVGLAIGHKQSGDPLQTLRTAAETLRSPNFEATILEARAKMATAAAWRFAARELPGPR